MGVDARQERASADRPGPASPLRAACRVLDRVDAWWFAPVPVLPMALARVLLGTVLLGAYLSLLPWYGEALAADGLLGGAFQADVPGMTIGRSTTQHLRWLQGVTAPLPMAVLYVALLLCSAAFTVGYRTRPAGAAALLLHLAFHGRNEFVFWGWPEMLTAFTLTVVLAPSCRRLSIDAWRRRRAGTTEQEVMAAWPLRLLQLHVALVYVVAAWSRLDNPHWLDGSMLSRILADGTFSRWPVLATAPEPLLAALTYAAWAVELASPFALWQAGTRRWFVAALVGLHAGLELLTRVGWWNVVMLAGLAAFAPLPWLEALVGLPARIVRRLRWRSVGRGPRSRGARPD